MAKVGLVWRGWLAEALVTVTVTVTLITREPGAPELRQALFG